ncbi:MAG TPA: type II 3-dehydroquinate dehydratase [Candidatus Limiplasma sp.]|nr:type II 3-dehydroquinate dehydratase [Candidatus Limiplasma sp.]
MKLLVINGPNLNLLGTREPDIYGSRTYAALARTARTAAAEAGVRLKMVQSNHEGKIVDIIQKAAKKYDGIVINPAAYTHTSVAIYDALKAVGLPTVEVHLSDIESREAFRRHSYISPACIQTIAGKGFDGYRDAIGVLVAYCKNHAQRISPHG